MTLSSTSVPRDTSSTRKKDRKAEGRKLKRQRIEAAGGVRPRRVDPSPAIAAGDHPSSVKVNVDAVPPASENVSLLSSFDSSKLSSRLPVGSPPPPPPQPSSVRQPIATDGSSHRPNSKSLNVNNNQHNRSSNTSRRRFGRVMDQPPCRNRPRTSTLSIAMPGSVVSNCQTRELKTLLAGQIARAATIYHVDEIVVFDDKLSIRRPSKLGVGSGYHQQRPRYPREASDQKSPGGESNDVHKDDVNADDGRHGNGDEGAHRLSFSDDPHVFLTRLLQYCECPQYLRRHFFPMHPDLQFVGLLPPMDAPHHVRAEDAAEFREGVVLDQISHRGMSMVNCGIRNRPVEINARLTPGIRCTVQLDPEVYKAVKRSEGKTTGKPLPSAKVVSPSLPRETNGTYWGYTVRFASSLKAVWEECPVDRRYDLKIGTSERGTVQLDNISDHYSIPSYEHALIVFGGVAGIEECVDADESIHISGGMCFSLFDQWVNVCPWQGSRTIRTEEAILISLAKLSPLLYSSMHQPLEVHVTTKTEKVRASKGDAIKNKPRPRVEFSDDEPSDESSCASSD